MDDKKATDSQEAQPAQTNATQSGQPTQKTLSLAQIALFPPLAVACAFVLSACYTLAYFLVLKIEPTSVPLVLSDYVLSFSVWGFGVIYIMVCATLSIIFKHAFLLSQNISSKTQQVVSDKNSSDFFSNCWCFFEKRIPKFTHFLSCNKYEILTCLTMIFLLCIISYLFFNFYLNIIISKTFITVAISLSVLNFWYIKSLFFENLPTKIIVIVFETIFSTCIAFSTFANYQIENCIKTTHNFKYDNVEVTGSLLRAFDKGILVCAPESEFGPDKNPRILFLPHDKGAVLAFPTTLCPKQVDPSKKSKADGLPNVG